MARFMAEGRYHQWQSLEENPHRIQIVHARDPDRPTDDAQNRDDVITELLAKEGDSYTHSLVK